MEELVLIKENKAFTTSRKVAVKFNKRHSDVLRAISNIEDIQGFRQRNFALAEYDDEQAKRRPEYIITRDGFVFLVMGFNGKKADTFKIEYINAFNKAEELLKANNKPMSIEEMMLYQLQGMIDTKKEVKELKEDNAVIKDELRELKAKITTSEDNYFTIAGYGSYIYMKIDKDTANQAGREAAKICRNMGYIIGKVPDAKYGGINTYPRDVIETVFKNIGLTK